jgi:hypothetical protein
MRLKSYRACSVAATLVGSSLLLAPTSSPGMASAAAATGSTQAVGGREQTAPAVTPRPTTRPPARPADREEALRRKRIKEEAERRRREAADRARDIAEAIAARRKRVEAAGRASEQYESYRLKSRGPLLDCEEKGAQQLVRGNLRVSVPADGCTGWFILNPEPEKAASARHWRWEPDGEVLVEVADLGGYGTFTETPSRSLSLLRGRTKGVRFKGLGKPVNITFGMDISFVVSLLNDTDRAIPYQILRDGAWETFTIQPKTQITHSWVGVTCCSIRYDHKYEAGYQEKKQDLRVMSIPDHDPTESEKRKAPLNYFKVDASGNVIELAVAVSF